MHPSRPSLLGFPSEHEGSRGYSSHPPMLLCSGCPPLADSQTRNSLKVLQSCGLKNDPLVQQTSSGLQSTCAAGLFGPSSHLEHRDVSRSGRAHCVRWGCATLPEDFTCPVSLGDTGQFDWTSRSLHSSCLTGQAQVDWVPEAFTRSCHTGQARVDWTFVGSCPWSLRLYCFLSTPFLDRFFVWE